MSLIHRVNVVLLLHMSILLVLENLCQNSLGACGLTLVVHNILITVALNTHSSSVNCVELVLDAGIGSWRSASTRSARVARTLTTLYSRNIKFSAVASDNVLSLVTARLYH